MVLNHSSALPDWRIAPRVRISIAYQPIPVLRIDLRGHEVTGDLQMIYHIHIMKLKVTTQVQKLSTQRQSVMISVLHSHKLY